MIPPRQPFVAVFSCWLLCAATAFHQPILKKKSSTKLMAHSGHLNAIPRGIGSAAPKTIVTNTDLESVVDTSHEWIHTRTGIEQRRVLLQHETIRGLGTQAAKSALEMSGLAATDLDLVICATSSADDMFGDATSIAAELGCDIDTMGFDLTAACSGFLFGIVTAGQFLSTSNNVKNALVVGADALSRWVDWEDRNSCILFGDGAGAMVLSRGDGTTSGAGILGYAAHSNGQGYGDLNCGYLGEAVQVSTPGEGTTLSKGSYRSLNMNGKEVYKFATREVPKVLEEALESARMKAEDIDWLVLHQANIRIIEIVAQRLGLPMEKVITNLHAYGNTSAASIPIALDEAVREGKVKKGDIIACAGFGAGLSWGAAIMRWGG